MSGDVSESTRLHLRWALLDGIGPTTFLRVMQRFGDLERANRAGAAELASVKGIGRDGAARLVAARESDELNAALEAEIAAAHEAGIQIVSRADELYPEGLKRIPDPPIVLYVRGELRVTDAIAIAIVGTRSCSIYGGEQARRFGELLASAGITVVSGLARGIDAFAHHGAVDAGGRSLAVLGSGLIEIYPPENRPLAERLCQHGACISELPMRSSVRRENFPSRNRIIAGLALGTLVVEAPARSGALITARLASEYNREVFVIPGRLQEAAAIGSNALIRDSSAKLVTCLEDILDELGELGQRLRPTAPAADKNAVARPSNAAPSGADPGPLFAEALGPAERLVFEALSDEPVLQETVLAGGGAAVGELLAAFTSLELKGMIRRLPGQRFVRRAAVRK